MFIEIALGFCGLAKLCQTLGHAVLEGTSFGRSSTASENLL